MKQLVTFDEISKICCDTLEVKFKDIDSYEKYEVILDKPNTSFNYRHSLYYTVSFTTKTGKKIIKDTAPIFSDWGNIASLHDYNNKKVNIAYNEKNDTLIVLSKQNNKAQLTNKKSQLAF